MTDHSQCSLKRCRLPILYWAAYCTENVFLPVLIGATWGQMLRLRLPVAQWALNRHVASLLKPVWVNTAMLELKSPIVLWLACRMMDFTSSGCVEVNITAMAELLGRTERSVKRYISDALELKYIRSVQPGSTKGTVTLYLSSSQSILADAEITSPGVRIQIFGRDLSLKRLRCMSTEAEAKQLQSQSFYAARKACKGSSNSKDVQVAKVDDYFNSASFLCVGARESNIHPFVFVWPDAKTHGGSQSQVGLKIGRHRKTVERRLSTKRRESVQLPELDRLQVLKAAPHDSFSVKQLKFLSRFAPTVNILGERNQPVKLMVRQFAMPVQQNDKRFKAWIFCPNLYQSLIEVRPDRWLKKKLRQIQVRVESSTQQIQELHLAPIQNRFQIGLPT